MARVRGLMRCTSVAGVRGGPVLSVGDLTLDEESHEVSRAGEEIALTATEFELPRGRIPAGDREAGDGDRRLQRQRPVPTLAEFQALVTRQQDPLLPRRRQLRRSWRG